MTHGFSYEGSEFAETTGSFRVQDFSLEMLNPESDPETMRALAAQTGGISVSPAGIDSVIAAVAPEAIIERSDREYRPALNPLIFLFLIIDAPTVLISVVTA